MKILHITNNYPTESLPVFGIFVKEQIESLSSINIENDVFFINGREKGKWEYVKSIKKIRNQIKKNHYDLIHCHHAFSAVCYILSAQSRKHKSIVSYQSDPSNELGKIIYKFIKRYVNVVIIKNNSLMVDNISVYNQPNGVNTSFFIPIEKPICYTKLNLNSKKKYIIFVSSNFIRKEKRYDKFKKVLSILKSKYGLEEVEELLLVNTNRELVPYYFNASSLHLLCSDFEGSPNSVKEAMACNIPVVSTDVGNVREILSGVNGSYVAKTNSAIELAELAYKALMSSKPINSREVIIEKALDIQSVAEKLLKIYKSI